MKSSEEFKAHLESLGACNDAKKWAEGKTALQAWEQCHRGDWLLWWSKKENVDLRVLTLAKGQCAKTVYHLMKDERSRKAVDAAIDFGNGLIERPALNAAAYAAAAAADAADAAAYAAAAAAYAAAADAAADAAAYAADAADAAAYAAADAAYAAAADAAAYAADAADAAAADAAADAAAYAAAADAAYAAAAYAADAAAYADAHARRQAREANQKLTSDIVRSIIKPDFL